MNVESQDWSGCLQVYVQGVPHASACFLETHMQSILTYGTDVHTFILCTVSGFRGIHGTERAIMSGKHLTLPLRCSAHPTSDPTPRVCMRARLRHGLHVCEALAADVALL